MGRQDHILGARLAQNNRDSFFCLLLTDFAQNTLLEDR